MTFYQKYSALCEERGISKSEAAERAGFAKSSVSKWSKDSSIRPTLDIIDKICRFFNVDRSYFLGDLEEDQVTFTGISEEDKELIHHLLSAPAETKAAIRVLLKKS